MVGLIAPSRHIRDLPSRPFEADLYPSPHCPKEPPMNTKNSIRTTTHPRRLLGHSGMTLVAVLLAACSSSEGPATTTTPPSAAPSTSSPPANPTSPIPTPSPGDGGVVAPTEPTLEVLAPLRDFAETRRLLRATVEDPDGLAQVSYTVNGGAPTSVPIGAGARKAAISAALALRPGANTVVLTAVDSTGARTTQTIPFRFGLLTSAGGSHSGAIVRANAYVFGRNNVGQLGLGPTAPTSVSTPTALAPLGVTPASLAFSQNISTLVGEGGEVFTWGENTNGESGQGDSGIATRRNLPTRVAQVDATVAAAGFNHVTVIARGGRLLAWGDNERGQVGVEGTANTDDIQPSPTPVVGAPANVVKVIAGSAHTVALTAEGKVYVWGRNTYGNLGNGAPTDELRHPTPAAVPGLDAVVDIATGRDHVLAVKEDGTVFSWGLGASGQLGTGALAASPVTAPKQVVTDEAAQKPLTNVALVFANGNSSFALSRTGALWGFGEDGNGTLAQGGAGGDGAKANRLPYAVRAGVYASPGGVPEYLDQRTRYRSIAVGALHVVALMERDELFTWGWNTAGTLGIADFPAVWRQPTPVVVVVP